MTVMTVMTHPHRTKTSILPGSTRQQNGVPVLQVPTIKTSTPEKKNTQRHTTIPDSPTRNSPLLHRYHQRLLCLPASSAKRMVVPSWSQSSTSSSARGKASSSQLDSSPKSMSCHAGDASCVGRKKAVVAMVVENAMGVEKPVCHWWRSTYIYI